MDIMKVDSIKKNNNKIGSTLPHDLLITVRTRKNHEEPYFLLYQCAENQPTGIASVAQIKITQKIPQTIEDIKPIFVSENISKECKTAILNWSHQNDIWGTNNWENLKDKYKSVNCENNFTTAFF